MCEVYRRWFLLQGDEAGSFPWDTPSYQYLKSFLLGWSQFLMKAHLGSCQDNLDLATSILGILMGNNRSGERRGVEVAVPEFSGSQHPASSRYNLHVLSTALCPQHILGLHPQSTCLTMCNGKGNLTASLTDLYPVLHEFSLPSLPLPEGPGTTNHWDVAGLCWCQQDHFSAILTAHHAFSLLRSSLSVTNDLLSVFLFPKCVTVFLPPVFFVLWDSCFEKIHLWLLSGVCREKKNKCVCLVDHLLFTLLCTNDKQEFCLSYLLLHLLVPTVPGTY